MGIYGSKTGEIASDEKLREMNMNEPPTKALQIRDGTSVGKLSVYCDLCYPQFDFVEAIRFCRTCHRYLCKVCFEYHKHSAAQTYKENSPTVEITTPECLTEIYPKGIDDKENCWISGMALLSTGDLVVVDGGNSTVKIIRTYDSVITSSLRLPSEPFDVAVTSRYEIGVTIPDQQQIQYLGILNGLSKTRRMRVDGHCFGIANKNTLTALSFICPEKVEIISNEGKIMTRIETDLKGKEVFSAPYYIVFCNEGKYVYVSDHRLDSVMKFSTGGRCVATYKAGDLDRPEALAVLEDGSVVVASRDTHCLHVISSKCNKLKIFKGEDGALERPWSLCYSIENKLLYVGVEDGKCITVYTK